MSGLPEIGAEAPGFILRDADEVEHRFGRGASDAAATLLFFFTHGCPTCDLTAPLVERLHSREGAGSARVG